MNRIASLVSGIVFGLGLTISEMINPAKVLGFLDLFGNWDPSLMFVMIGALVVSSPMFHLNTLKNKKNYANKKINKKWNLLHSRHNPFFRFFSEKVFLKS